LVLVYWYSLLVLPLACFISETTRAITVKFGTAAPTLKLRQYNLILVPKKQIEHNPATPIRLPQGRTSLYCWRSIWKYRNLRRKLQVSVLPAKVLFFFFQGKFISC